MVDVVTGPNLWEPGAERRYDVEAWATALKALETICERGERLGVKIGFEPCWGTLAHDAATAERVLSAVPVAITFDPSHFVLSEDDVPALVRRWGERIVNVHLKDAFGRPGMDGEDFHFCLLGEGRVPWGPLLAALDEVGYEGAMAVEFEAHRYYEQVLGSDPEAAAALAASQVKALLGAPGGAGMRVALCGLGEIGQHHLAAIRSCPDLELVAVCDLDEELARRDAGSAAVHTSVGAMLAAEEIDAVDVCLPHSLHRKVAEHALAAGCDVLLEKPLALDLEDCDAIIATAAAAGRRVAVSYNQLFYGPHRRLPS